MIASFEYELTRAGEDDIFYLEIVYSGSRYGSRWNSEYEAELVSVMLDGKDFPTTAAEDDAILAAAYDQIADDFTDHECSYGDYINDLRGDR